MMTDEKEKNREQMRMAIAMQAFMLLVPTSKETPKKVVEQCWNLADEMILLAVKKGCFP